MLRHQARHNLGGGEKMKKRNKKNKNDNAKNQTIENISFKYNRS